MKLIAVIALAAAFGACTSTSTTSTTPRPSHRDLAEKRVYTKEQFDKTGRQTVGGGLEQSDASIRLSGESGR